MLNKNKRKMNNRILYLSHIHQSADKLKVKTKLQHSGLQYFHCTMPQTSHFNDRKKICTQLAKPCSRWQKWKMSTNRNMIHDVTFNLTSNNSTLVILYTLCQPPSWDRDIKFGMKAQSRPKFSFTKGECSDIVWSEHLSLAYAIRTEHSIGSSFR